MGSVTRNEFSFTFAAASLLICAGAVLDRLKMHRHLLLELLFIQFYALNEVIAAIGRRMVPYVDPKTAWPDKHS